GTASSSPLACAGISRDVDLSHTCNRLLVRRAPVRLLQPRRGHEYANRRPVGGTAAHPDSIGMRLNVSYAVLSIGASSDLAASQLVCGPWAETRLPSVRLSIGLRIT